MAHNFVISGENLRAMGDFYANIFMLSNAENWCENKVQITEI